MEKICCPFQEKEKTTKRQLSDVVAVVRLSVSHNNQTNHMNSVSHQLSEKQ